MRMEEKKWKKLGKSARNGFTQVSEAATGGALWKRCSEHLFLRTPLDGCFSTLS